MYSYMPAVIIRIKTLWTPYVFSLVCSPVLSTNCGGIEQKKVNGKEEKGKLAKTTDINYEIHPRKMYVKKSSSRVGR